MHVKNFEKLKEILEIVNKQWIKLLNQNMMWYEILYV